MIRPLGYLLIILPIITEPLLAVEISLAESELLALENSFELKNRKFSIEVAKLSYKLGIRRYMPELSFSYSDSRTVKYNAHDSDSIQLGLSITQPIFNGGRHWIQRKLSAIQLSLQTAGLAIQAQEIRDKVWQQYHQIVISANKLALQKELMELSQDKLSITAKKYELGSIREIDLIEARIEVQSLEIDIATTESQNRRLIAQFRHLIGVPADTELQLLQEINTGYGGLDIEVQMQEELYQLALRNNPDLRSVQFETRQAKARFDIASRTYLPNLSLEGKVSLSSDELPLQNPAFTVKLNIEFPFKALPLKSSFSISSTARREYSSAQTQKISLLSDMNFITDRKTASIALQSSFEKEENSRKELQFSINEILQQLLQKRSVLELNRKAIKLQEQKLLILEKQYELGQVKEIDLIKGSIEYYNKEIGLWEKILDLVLTERTLEKKIGLELGKLRILAEQFSN